VAATGEVFVELLDHWLVWLGREIVEPDALGFGAGLKTMI